MTEAAQRTVKLSCQGLWKVYGPHADRIRRHGDLFGSDRAAACDRLRAGGHIPAVIDANFVVHAGEIFVIMGLSGSGKSTLVRCLSRLIEPSFGQVLLDGEDLLAANSRRLIELRRREMGMVFQHFGLLPHLNVLDNVAFPLRVQGRPTEERYSRAHEMISLVGLEGREQSFPNQLSGGQQQRVAIARALVHEPKLIICDEPTAALDSENGAKVMEILRTVATAPDRCVIIVTHDNRIFKFADRMTQMEDGRISHTQDNTTLPQAA